MRQPRPKQLRDSLARARYFNRQVVLPTDLTQDQIYALARFRRHNRLLHGWGVVGPGLVPEKVDPSKTVDDLRKLYGTDPAGVEPASGHWIVVGPGYALTPLGDEILLTCSVFIDVTREYPDGSLLVVPADCRRATAERPLDRSEETWALVVEAWEEPSGAVRTATARCGDHCDHFEFARTEDTFVFKLVRTLLSPWDGLSNAEKLKWLLRGDAKRCGVQIGTVTFKDHKVSQASDTGAELLKNALPPRPTPGTTTT
jgi:hypothetical protein